MPVKIFVFVLTVLLHDPSNNTTNGIVLTKPFHTQEECQAFLNDESQFLKPDDKILGFSMQCIDGSVKIQGRVKA